MEAQPLQRRSLDVGVLVRRTESLLQAGVPLSLLIDLGDASGPRSGERYATEGGQWDWLKRTS